MTQVFQHDSDETDIAIVGMAAHLPGAADIDAYWQMLREGRRAIRRLSDDELLAAGEDPGLIRHKDYVPFAAPLDGFEMFDAEFFGFAPKDAAIMDPQHRQFLETAWEALENAGHVPENFDGASASSRAAAWAAISISTSAPTRIWWKAPACSCCAIPAMTRIS